MGYEKGKISGQFFASNHGLPPPRARTHSDSLCLYPTRNNSFDIQLLGTV